MRDEDLELLKLAAQAAGREFRFWTHDGLCLAGMKSGEPLWNPLTDDGDALRLAVKLGISVDAPDPEKLVHPHSPAVDSRQEGWVTASIRGDGYRYRSPQLRRWYCRVQWVSMAEFERVKNCEDAGLLQLWRDSRPEKFHNAYSATRRAIVLAAAEIGRSHHAG